MYRRSIVSLINLSFRIGGLGLKTLLSIFMGRYLKLEDLGTYGIVFALVTLAVAVFGFRLDYLASRRLAVATPEEAARVVWDQLLFYLTNYVIAAVGSLAIWLAFRGSFSLDYLLLTLSLATLESIGNMLYINVTSMGRSTAANALFFIRSAAWVPLLLLAWIFIPASRTVGATLGFWLVGAAISILLNAAALRRLPWGAVLRTKVDWPALLADVRRCLPIWFGGLGLVGGAYVDRFIVSHFLGLKAAGVASFYFSFVYSTLALVQTGVLAIAYPKLIRLNESGARAEFLKETRVAAISVAVFSAIVSVGVGLSVAYVGRYTGHTALVSQLPVLWLMLVGIFLRCNSETVYYILFARHQDKPIWSGNLFYLLLSTALNFFLVQSLGLIGIGWSAILTSAFLLLWRLWFAYFPEKPVTVLLPRLGQPVRRAPI